MANQVTKIYEVKTLGYDTLIEQLNNIDKTFASIKKTKQELNALKFSTEDTAKIEELNKKLADEIIKTKELKLEKQKLMNEKKVLSVATDQEAVASKKNVAQIIAETGSLADLIAKRKELKTLLSSKNPASNPTIPFGGQTLSFSEATNKAKEMDRQISTLRQNMSGMGSIGGQVNAALANGFDRMKGSLSSMIFTYTGWFAAFREAGQLISQNIKLSDSFADLQIRIHGTGEDVERLFESLRKIDTRTSLASLVDIANIVAKKGVPKEEIAALTAEFDKLNVVLGNEIGDPASAASSIIKLITIFNDDKHVTAERVNEIGTSLFKLTTSGVATGEFLINFAERVGAVRGITGLALPNILGMGAALQQLGQRTEVAGTAAVQLTTRVFADVPKFAKAAGKSVEEFRKILDDNPFEAVIQVAEGLKNIQGDLEAAGFEDVVKAFGEVGVTGVRIKAVLGDIGTNAQFVRDRMAKAAATTADYANQTAAADLKQNTFAATLSKVRKALEGIASTEGVRLVLAGIASALLLLVNNIPTLLVMLGLLGVSWAAQNAALFGLRVQLVLYNFTLGINYAVLLLLNLAYGAHIILMGALNLAYGLVTRAAALFGIALKATPIGLILTGLTLLIAAMKTFGQGVDNASEAIRRQSQLARINATIAREAAQASSDQRAEVKLLVGVTNDLSISEQTRLANLQKLIDIDPVFQKALVDGKINYTKLNEALIEYNGNLRLSTELEAAKSINLKESQRLTDLNIKKQELESAISRKNFKDLDEETKKALTSKALGPLGTGILTESSFLKAARAVVKDIDKEIEAQAQLVEASATAFNERVKRAEPKVPPGSGVAPLVEAVEIDITKLKEQIENLNKQIQAFKGAKSALKKLVDDRDKIQDELDKALNKKQPKTPTYRGARLSGDDKDELAKIKAEMDEKLAIRETEYARLRLDHKATFEEEIDYVNDIKNIQQKYTQQRIDYLEAQGKLNARERKELGDAKKDLADIELKAQQDIQAIHDRDFNFQKANLKTVLDGKVANINLEVEAIEKDASQTNEARARARADGDKKILDLVVAYQDDIDALEKKLNQNSTENAREGAASVARAQQAILDNSVKILNAKLQDANNAGQSIIDEFRINAAERTLKILNDPKLSPLQIARELEKIQADLNRNLNAATVAQLKIELDLYRQGKESRIKTEQEAKEALRKLKEVEVKQTIETIDKELTAFERFFKALKGFVKDAGENVFGIKKYAKTDEGEARKREDALKEAANSIRDAMQAAEDGYFQRQEQKIEQARNIAGERIDLEEEQLKARAQSEAEIQSIEAQSAEKRKAIDKKAAEEKKKLALKELAIDYAKAVLKSLAQYGLPLALIPIAGATALYLIQRGNVNSQQFKQGGMPKKDGGPIVGEPHTRGGVKFVYEAEDAEAYIINKNSMRRQDVHTVTGTNAQIASAINRIGGGVDFKPGARVFESGGFLGTSYPAPNYKPSSTSTDTEALRLEFRIYADRVDRWVKELQVVQDPNTVSDAQKKIVKQNNVGALR